MTALLYMTDSYLKEWDAEVKSVNGKFVVLDRTAFFPQGGGVPSDEGIIKKGNEEFKVLFAKKMEEEVSLETEREGLQPGDKVHCILNWERRYQHMRMHTAAHIISAIIHREANAMITGNQIGMDKTRIDFSLENMDREKMNEYLAKANEAVQRNLPVKVSFMKREEALQMPGMVKLAHALPPNIEILRIVEIGDVDMQADGGPHVAAAGEIGKIEMLSLDNKGKSNRRLYYMLS